MRGASCEWAINDALVACFARETLKLRPEATNREKVYDAVTGHHYKASHAANSKRQPHRPFCLVH